MRLLTSGLVALVLALPAPALGQTLKPADLVGTWVIPHDGKRWSDSLQGKVMVDMLTLNADGSYTRTTTSGDSVVAVQKATKGRQDANSPFWQLAGDTLRFGSEGVHPLTYILRLKDGRLVLWSGSVWAAGQRAEKCAERVYERFDPAKPLTLRSSPQIAIQPADLVGTWAGRLDHEDWGTVVDTLVIGADYTIRVVHFGPVDDNFLKGTWELLPGNRIKVLAGCGNRVG